MTQEERDSRKRSVKDRAAVILNGMMSDGSACSRHVVKGAVDASLTIEELVEEMWHVTEEKIVERDRRRISKNLD